MYLSYEHGRDVGQLYYCLLAIADTVLIKLALITYQVIFAPQNPQIIKIPARHKFSTQVLN